MNSDGSTGRGRPLDLLATEPRSVPAVLAGVHRDLPVDARVEVLVRVGEPPEDPTRATEPFWSTQRLADVVEGAGFGLDPDSVPANGSATEVRLELHRLHTLPDTVGSDMALLICGLNPSVYAADTAVGFGRPGNRFWPAALAVGLVGADRDPEAALENDGVGMTDVVKRTTRAASELEPGEYRSGIERVERLVEWLEPAAVCFVGLAGWRIARDRKAGAGLQPVGLGGRPVYLMPSTSGLNAHSGPADFEHHLRAAHALGG